MTTATTSKLEDLELAVTARREEEELLFAQIVDLQRAKQAALEDTARKDPSKLKAVFRVGGTVAGIDAKIKKAEARIANIGLEVPALNRALEEERAQETDRRIEGFRQRAATLNEDEKEGYRAFGETFAQLLTIFRERILPPVQEVSRLKTEGQQAGLVNDANAQEWDRLARHVLGIGNYGRVPTFDDALARVFELTCDPDAGNRHYQRPAELLEFLPDLTEMFREC